jgi:hypothetical protein
MQEINFKQQKTESINEAKTSKMLSVLFVWGSVLIFAMCTKKHNMRYQYDDHKSDHRSTTINKAS